MKLVTITITLALVALGTGVGHQWGYFEGRDAVHTAMMDSMSGMAMGQMGGRR